MCRTLVIPRKLWSFLPTEILKGEQFERVSCDLSVCVSKIHRIPRNLQLGKAHPESLW